MGVGSTEKMNWLKLCYLEKLLQSVVWVTVPKPTQVDEQKMLRRSK